MAFSTLFSKSGSPAFGSLYMGGQTASAPAQSSGVNQFMRTKTAPAPTGISATNLGNSGNLQSYFGPVLEAAGQNPALAQNMANPPTGFNMGESGQQTAQQYGNDMNSWLMANMQAYAASLAQQQQANQQAAGGASPPDPLAAHTPSMPGGAAGTGGTGGTGGNVAFGGGTSGTLSGPAAATTPGNQIPATSGVTDTSWNPGAHYQNLIKQGQGQLSALRETMQIAASKGYTLNEAVQIMNAANPNANHTPESVRQLAASLGVTFPVDRWDPGAHYRNLIQTGVNQTTALRETLQMAVQNGYTLADMVAIMNQANPQANLDLQSAGNLAKSLGVIFPQVGAAQTEAQQLLNEIAGLQGSVDSLDPYNGVAIQNLLDKLGQYQARITGYDTSGYRPDFGAAQSMLGNLRGAVTGLQSERQQGMQAYVDKARELADQAGQLNLWDEEGLRRAITDIMGQGTGLSAYYGGTAQDYQSQLNEALTGASGRLNELYDYRGNLESQLADLLGQAKETDFRYMSDLSPFREQYETLARDVGQYGAGQANDELAALLDLLQGTGNRIEQDASTMRARQAEEAARIMAALNGNAGFNSSLALTPELYDRYLAPDRTALFDRNRQLNDSYLGFARSIGLNV